MLLWCQHLQKRMRGGLRTQSDHVLTLNIFDMWARELIGNSVKRSEYVQYSHLKRVVCYMLHLSVYILDAAPAERLLHANEAHHDCGLNVLELSKLCSGHTS